MPAFQNQNAQDPAQAKVIEILKQMLSTDPVQRQAAAQAASVGQMGDGGGGIFPAAQHAPHGVGGPSASMGYAQPDAAPPSPVGQGVTPDLKDYTDIEKSFGGFRPGLGIGLGAFGPSGTPPKSKEEQAREAFEKAMGAMSQAGAGPGAQSGGAASPSYAKNMEKKWQKIGEEATELNKKEKDVGYRERDSANIHGISMNQFLNRLPGTIGMGMQAMQGLPGQISQSFGAVNSLNSANLQARRQHEAVLNQQKMALEMERMRQETALKMAKMQAKQQKAQGKKKEDAGVMALMSLMGMMGGMRGMMGSGGGSVNIT